MPNLWEQFSKGLADAVADIREKAVEEPLYGRALNGPEMPSEQASEPQPHWPEARQPQTIERAEPSYNRHQEQDQGLER